VLRCVAVRCSVLQCVAVCCSVLQCVAVQFVAVCCSGLQCVAVGCSVLQWVAVCDCTLKSTPGLTLTELNKLILSIFFDSIFSIVNFCDTVNSV